MSSSSADDKQVLNIFRELDEPYEDTLTTDELVDELPVGKRAVQGYVKELEKDNKLVLEHEGKPNHWKLADTEPAEPVYDPRVGKAKRWANKARFIGNWVTLFGIAILAATGILTSNHILSLAVDFGLPMADAETAVTAGFVGVAGGILFLIGFAAYAFSLTLPRLAEWWLDKNSSSDTD